MKKTSSRSVRSTLFKRERDFVEKLCAGERKWKMGGEGLSG